LEKGDGRMKTLTKEQLMNLFANRTDIFAMQLKETGYVPVRREITMEDLEKHLKGDITIGLYCLNKENKVKWGCVDLDGEPEEQKRLEALAGMIYELFPDYERMIEDSGRRGFHIWIFFKEPIGAAYVQKLIKARLNSISIQNVEVFPKQTSLTPEKPYGNLCKIPCGIHKVSGRRSIVIKWGTP
jgi:hypothetical protein